jgi:hypothetical protein
MIFEQCYNRLLCTKIICGLLLNKLCTRVKVDISTSIGEMDIVVGEVFTAQVQNFLAHYNILERQSRLSSVFGTVLRIRIRRIPVFLGLLDPDPDPSIIKQKK